MPTPLVTDLRTTVATLDALTASLAVARTADEVHDLAAAYAAELGTVRRALAALTAGAGTATADAAGQARADHPDTARAAALAEYPKTGGNRERVLLALYRARIDGVPEDGLTDEGITAATKLGPNSARPRRVELVDGGWVVDSGKRVRVRGRWQIVWVVTDKALAHYGRSSGGQ